MKNIFLIAQCVILLFSCQIYHAADTMGQVELRAKRVSGGKTGMNNPYFQLPGEVDSKHTVNTAMQVRSEMITGMEAQRLLVSLQSLSEQFRGLTRPEACKQLPYKIKDVLALCSEYEKCGLLNGFEANAQNKIQCCKQGLETLLRTILHGPKDVPTQVMSPSTPRSPTLLPLSEGDFVTKRTSLLTIDPSSADGHRVCIHESPRNATRGGFQSPLPQVRSPFAPCSPTSPPMLPGVIGRTPSSSLVSQLSQLSVSDRLDTSETQEKSS